MARVVILTEIDLTSPEGDPVTLSVCDRAIRPLRPADPDRPNQSWDDRLVEPPSIRRQLFDDLASLSPGLGYGEIVLANGDRAMDAYQGHAWGEVRVWRWTEGDDFADAVLLLQGLCGPAGYSRATSQPSRVRIPLYDYRAELERPLQTALYGGSNGVGGELYDGEAGGLKGRPKPIAWGDLADAHVPAPLVNGGVLAHQLHDGSIEGPITILDRGDDAGFGDDGDYVGAAFDAHAPAAAHSATDLGRGLVKMNGQPVGAVAFGLKGEDSPTYVETVGPIAARLLARAGVPSGRIGASIADLSAEAVIGAWFGEPVDARTALAWIARSAPAAIAPGRTGMWEAALFGPPAAEEDWLVEADEIVSLEADQTVPAPVGEVRVGWGRIWTPYRPSDLAPDLVGTDEATALGSEWRWATLELETVKERHPRGWRTLELTTALREEADAEALAESLAELFGLAGDGRPRRMWRVVLELTPERLSAELGQTVRLSDPDAGLDDRYLLIGEELMKPRRDLVTWTLWG